MAYGNGCCSSNKLDPHPEPAREQDSEQTASTSDRDTGAPQLGVSSLHIETTDMICKVADGPSLYSNADSTMPQEASKSATSIPRQSIIDFQDDANGESFKQLCCSTAAASACTTSARSSEARKAPTSCATSAYCMPKDATAPFSTMRKVEVDCAASCCEIGSVSSGCGDGCCGEREDECEDECGDDCCGQEGGEGNCCGEKMEKCKDGCCDEESEDREDDCWGQDSDAAKDEKSCSNETPAKACCITDRKTVLIDAIEMTSSASHDFDLEKGSTGKEHIILSVSGMTCTGCETKLKRVLGMLNYVSNLKTSLILARAEMDITEGGASVEDVIKHLHRTTEFKCERLSNQGISLDLICSGDPLDVFKDEWPGGILEITAVDKNTIRVNFDAKVVGARDLLEQPWAQSLRLAPPRSDVSLDAGSRHVRQMGLLTLISAILTIPVLVLAWAPLPEREIAYGSASLALATIVQVGIAGPFYPKAIKALVFSKVIEMDLLIVLSTSAAYIFSVVSFGYLVAGRPLSTGEFFETSTLLVTLIMVGRWVASLARQKAAESISIRALQAHTAVLVGPKDTEKEIDARLLQFGDIFKVVPDTRIPTDGTVISGASEVDESMLTGESVPIEKHPGSNVIAGSINGMGMLKVRLTRLPGDNTISTIACMVDETKLSKPKIQDIADKVASYFVPVVVTLTIITFAIWMAIGVAVRKKSGSEAAIEAITYAITVLIVSCPCAIGLAVPMVIVVASGVAAKRGVIFKSANSIEIAYKTTDVVFDKTGTLTMGQLKVFEEAFLNGDAESNRACLLGMVKGIKHPVSVAVASHLDSQATVAATLKDVRAIAGKGVEGRLNGKILRAGNSIWLNASSHPQVQAMLSKGLTAFCFTIDSELVAVFGLQDTLRAEAPETVTRLQKQGLRVHILSGDDDGAVQAVGAQLSVPPSAIRSRCSPGDKQSYIKDLIDMPLSDKQGKTRRPVVIFVGDGTNDAVALAQATIGVHMSSGTDMAQSAADVVLVRSDLSCILTMMILSRKAMHRVGFNFGWSFVYNLFAVLLGAGAFVNARIPPEYAGLGELVSVLPVILAAVLLRWSHI